MKNALEIAKDELRFVRELAESANAGTCAPVVIGVDELESRIAEAIQQAREDGAEWAKEQLATVTTASEFREFNPADVRNAGDDGDAGKGGT